MARRPSASVAGVGSVGVASTTSVAAIVVVVAVVIVVVGTEDSTLATTTTDLIVSSHHVAESGIDTMTLSLTSAGGTGVRRVEACTMSPTVMKDGPVPIGGTR